MSVSGIVDPHVHAGPCVVDRTQDADEVVRDAVEAGYRGLVFKSPGFETATMAGLVKPSDGSLEVGGGIVLGHVSGGLNPAAVEAMFEVRTADGTRPGRVVWMPSRDAEDHLAMTPRPGVTPVDLWDGTEPKPALVEILDLVRQHDGVVATSHLGYDQARRFVGVARARGLERVVVTHAEMDPVSMSPEQKRELSAAGAVIEHAYASALVGPHARAEILRGRRTVPVEEIVAGIRAAGIGRSIVCTDFGGLSFDPPVAGMLEFIELLEKAGLTQAELDTVASGNALELFWG